MDVEKVKFLKEAEQHMTAEAYQNLVRDFGFNADKIEPRLRGLKSEDEFQLMLIFLDCCETITPQEQSLQSSVDKTIVAPDLFCKFKGKRSCFIEIKSTVSSKVKFSPNDLEKRKKFAEKHGYPLLVAVKIKGLWGLFSVEYIENNNRRIEPKDFPASQLERYTGAKTYVLMEGITLKNIYSENGTLGVRNPKFGELESWEVGYKNNSFKIDKKTEVSLIYSMVFEFLHDYLINDQNIEKDEKKYVLSGTLMGNLFIQTHYAFLFMVRHMENKDGERHSYTTYLNSLKRTGESIPIKPVMIENIFSELRSCGIPILPVVW